MDGSPILSICIPTYNRAEHLKKCIESIVCQEEFTTGEVEVVVSDNCSNDNTRDVAYEYSNKYKNFHYFNNAENIRDRNFPLSISRASGIYRKLSNDTMIWHPGSMAYMVHQIKNKINDKPVMIFYPNDEEQSIKASSLDETLGVIGYYATSISCFGVWADHFCYNENGCDKFLWQTEFLLKNIVEKKDSLIITKKLYAINEIKKKDLSYGLFNVFYNNFLGMVRYWLDRGQVSPKVYEEIRKKLLLTFFSPYVANYNIIAKDKYIFSQSENFKQCIEDAYKDESYYKEFLRKTKKIEFSLMHPKFTELVRRILNIVRRQKG